MEHMQITLSEDCHLGKAGQSVSLALTPADVHDPTEIPTYLAGYKNWAYRADEASKIVLVDNDEDKYRSFSSDDAFEPVKVKGSIQAPVPEVDPRSSLSTYKVVDRFVGSFIPTTTEGQKTNNGYNLRMAAARRCRRAIDMDRELDVLGATGLLTTSTNFAAAQRLALGAGENWNNGATADPIYAILTAVENSDQPVTDVWINQLVAKWFLLNDKVRDHMRQMLGDTPAAAIAASIANAGQSVQPVDFFIPGLPPIHVSSTKYKNSSGSIVYIFPNVVSLLTVTPGVPQDGEEIATSYTFRRRGPSGVGFESREYFIENRGPAGGTMVVVATADAPTMTGSNCGGIITNVIV